MIKMASMGIVLINPNDRPAIFQDLYKEFASIEPSVFAGLFATYLRQKDVPVRIIDAPAYELSIQQTARYAVEDNPVLVVVVVYGAQPSASTQNMTAAIEIAKTIRLLEGPPVMLMGTHPAALPLETMLENEAITFVCDREGPATIYKTYQALLAKETDFSKIPSLWWREEGRIVPPKSTESLLDDLDTEMPGIAWDLLPMDKYRAHNWHSFDHIEKRSPYAAIHTSLGCPYRCHFCCINAPFGKPSYRMWSPETVIKEIDYLHERYGVVNIKFVDEMFVLNRSHVLDLCSLLANRSYKVNIWAYARVDTVQDEFLEALKSAGVNWLCLGIESASKHVRDGALKKYTNEDIIESVRKIQAAGIYVIGNFIFGLPDDTVERMQETLDLALELNCEFANFYSAMPYPGSALYKEAKEKGWKLPERWVDYSQHGYGTYPLANQYVSSAEILRFRDNAFRLYFTSEGYLNMLNRKFGSAVVEHVNKMMAVPLKRKLLGN